MNLFTKTESPAEVLRKAVERDVNLVLAACLPDNFVSNTTEEKMILGCLHPINDIKIDQMTGSVVCTACMHSITRPMAILRFDQAKANGEM